MAIFLLFTGFSFWIPSSDSSTSRVACIALGIYLFGIVYSPGEGPVPFTYSAEAYPLYVRTIGMSLATATTWFFNAVLGVTWPSLQRAFRPQGAFGFYAAWNIVGWWAVLLFLPVSQLHTFSSVHLRTYARKMVDTNDVATLGNQGEDARRTGSSLLRSYTCPRRVRITPDSVLLQAVFATAKGRARGFV